MWPLFRLPSEWPCWVVDYGLASFCPRGSLFPFWPRVSGCWTWLLLLAFSCLRRHWGSPSLPRVSCLPRLVVFGIRRVAGRDRLYLSPSP